MKRITFYLDFISPYAYLAFERLPQSLLGLSYSVQYRPLLFAALLKHHGQLGPAEIGPKREWTYRQVLWLARSHGIAFDLPAAHPFNPLPLLRLALACGEDGNINRYVAETVFRHVWRGGADAVDAQRREALTLALAPARDPASDQVKTELKASTDAAIARGLFGVPTFELDQRLFWGFEALPLLRAALEGDPWLEHAWESAGQVAWGATRQP